MNELEPVYVDDFEKIRHIIEQARQKKPLIVTAVNLALQFSCLIFSLRNPAFGDIRHRISGA